MALKERITNSVNKAFDKIDSLLVNATLTSKFVSDFDMTAGSIINTQTTIVKRVFLEEKISRSSEGSVKVIKVYFKSDGSNYSVYDTLTINLNTYNVILTADSGYLITMELSNV